MTAGESGGAGEPGVTGRGPWSDEELADLPGVSASRTHQILPGAMVAVAAMDIFDLDELEICPWALREGVILERIDQFSAVDR